jgi:ATP-binding cassette subfamily B protein
VLNLATRFYDATRGEVRFDDTPVQRCRLFSLRAQMGIVFQESFLFNTSIRDNIRLGKPGATDEEIEAAARAAEIHDLIAAMPDGYDTNVGEGGGKLSGGQRQRIAIARAMIRDPSVLVLDEATSALDPATEAALNDTLYKLAAGRTVISVTHRLAAITGFDSIFVMDKGALVETGDHEELLARDGVYANLWAKQSGFAVSDDGLRATIDAGRLAKLPLFDKVTAPALLEQLAAEFDSEHYEPGDTVVFEGQRTDKFHVLVRGRIEMVQRCFVGGERPLGLLEEGDSFGMLPLLLDAPYRATYRAIEPCLLITLERAQFMQLTERSPEARDAIQTMKKQRYLEQLFGPRVRGARKRDYATSEAAALIGLG